jgi:hypothetical protein
MNGWKYEWIGDLPQEVYEVLIAMVSEHADAENREP